MKLTNYMHDASDATAIGVFRFFVARLLALQKKLVSLYHGDRFLRDRFITAVDIPIIQDSLSDRTPRSAQELMNREQIDCRTGQERVEPQL